MIKINNTEEFIRAFALRDALFRSISLIGSTFTIAAISLLPGFGVKGLLVATSIQLLLSAFLELPTSIIADRFGRSIILRASLILKVFVSVALGFAIFFASQGKTQFVWYAFFLEAFLDAISNTLISGSYQVAYLSLYDSLPLPPSNSKQPLFLSSFKYGIKFRLFFPIAFILAIISIFRIFEVEHQNLYNCSFMILGIIILARTSLFLLFKADFKGMNPKLDRSNTNIKSGLKQVFSAINTKKTIFITYSLTCLLGFLGILYLTGQSMKLLPEMGLKSELVWMAAIVTSIFIYLIRTAANILILPKISSEKIFVIMPAFGFLVILLGTILSGVDTYFNSIITKYIFFIILTAFTFVVSDALAKSIESSLKEILKSDYKATWLSLANTFAYLVFGFLSVLMSNLNVEDSNLVVGVLLVFSGLFILTSQLFSKPNTEQTSFIDVLRFHLIKILLVIVVLVVTMDLLSYFMIVNKKMEETRIKTASTVLLGMKSDILQGNIIEASNFLYSLKSGNFIKCFELNALGTSINDCQLNGFDLKGVDTELVDIKYDLNSFGKIKLHFDLNHFRKDIYLRVVIDILISFLLYAILFYAFYMIAKSVSREVHSLYDSLQSDEGKDISEFKIREFKEIYVRLVESIKMRENFQFQSAMVNVASQVSHDIRSPLSALSLMTSQLAQVPEEKRIIIRSAVNRINDIANQLLLKGKEVQIHNTNLNSNSNLNNSEIPYQKLGSHKMSISDQLLSPIVDSIISEKRIQYREKQGIEIEGDINKSYGLFAKINASELKRVISNLVNNSVESFFNETGKITVSVRSLGEQVSILVQDNGKGIPQELIKHLGERGVTHGKEDSQSGSGLGLYHAKRTVENFGGQLVIESIEGRGTSIKMNFNRAPAPNWFVEKLNLSPLMVISSLDDDISIHQIWKGRFESKNTSHLGIEHQTFTSGAEFKAWYVSQSMNSDINNLYLVDYELLDQNTTGLDIIEELGIGSNAILVTSRYEEESIRQRCELIGVRLIPKAMAGFVPIEISKTVNSKIRYDLCLLDDDRSLVQRVWEMVAKTKGHTIKIFSTPEEFQLAADFIDPETPIFIDVSLANGVSGVEFSEEVHKLGFLNINLATGYSSDSIHLSSFVGRIIGKDYPEFI